MRHERRLILLFCGIAAVRVFLFSVAFPFFNNVDEQAHVDLVIKYARGQVPRDLGHYSSESAVYFSLYGSPEYFTAPQQFNTGTFPPPNWTFPLSNGTQWYIQQQLGGKRTRTTNRGNRHFTMLSRVCG